MVGIIWAHASTEAVRSVEKFDGLHDFYLSGTALVVSILLYLKLLPPAACISSFCSSSSSSRSTAVKE